MNREIEEMWFNSSDNKKLQKRQKEIKKRDRGLRRQWDKGWVCERERDKMRGEREKGERLRGRKTKIRRYMRGREREREREKEVVW